MNDNNKYKELYILAELSYKNKFNNIETNNLFPIDWYQYENYKEKIDIIADALKNNILLENTDSYKDYIAKRKELSLN